MHPTGLHHTTTLTARLADNLAFYRDLLGLRLVMNSVDQDDPRHRHLAYGDGAGRPGTLLTFVEVPRAAPHRPRHGEVSEIALGLPGEAAAEFWLDRLAVHGCSFDYEVGSGGASVALHDPDGQRLRLVDVGSAAEPVATWPDAPVPAEVALRGLAGVTLRVPRLEPTVRFLVDLLGLPRGPAPDLARTRRLDLPLGRAQRIRLFEDATTPRRGIGAGGVHHVALGVPARALPRWRERFVAAGRRPSGVVDRGYASALYVREPGGVLVELASDEFDLGDPARLGERLLLPPRLEAHRREIEAALPPLPTTPPAPVEGAPRARPD